MRLANIDSSNQLLCSQIVYWTKRKSFKIWLNPNPKGGGGQSDVFLNGYIIKLNCSSKYVNVCKDVLLSLFHSMRTKIVLTQKPPIRWKLLLQLEITVRQQTIRQIYRISDKQIKTGRRTEKCWTTDGLVCLCDLLSFYRNEAHLWTCITSTQSCEFFFEFISAHVSLYLFV